jgi:signal transduction histidine kinase
MSSVELFTRAARNHAARLTRAIEPVAGRLEREFGKWLRAHRYDPAQRRALAGITPLAAARAGGLARFVEQVERHGRSLARWNLPPPEAHEALAEFGRLLAEALEGRFAPSREQIHLATVLALTRAYYQVREAETQALFAIYRADAECSDTLQFLRRLAGILTRGFGAQAGRLLALDQPPSGKLASPRSIAGGTGQESAAALIADPSMRGKYASYWSLPLAQRHVLQLAFAAQRRWMPRERSLLEAASKRVGEVLDRRRLETELRQAVALARQAEEKERRRIGCELHDQAAQSLLALRLELELIERELTGGLRRRLRRARGIAERAAVDLRRTIAALSPAVLERLGLAAALRQLVATFGRTHPAKPRLRISGQADGLSPAFQELVYRVAQECLNNVAKHSRATHVILLLVIADKRIRLRIADDGTGFAVGEASKPMSFCLAGMKDRAALLHAALTVKSVPGRGTVVTLEWPQKPARAVTTVVNKVMVGSNVKNSSTSH